VQVRRSIPWRHYDPAVKVVDESLIAEAGVGAHRTLRELQWPADAIVVSRDYADRWRGVCGGFIHAAFSQGCVLAG
jgi:hypothetical protein